MFYIVPKIVHSYKSLIMLIVPSEQHEINLMSDTHTNSFTLFFFEGSYYQDKTKKART